ncbi:uncharacterized protein LOC134184941 [Corticium candelabrum]|uniref:uncharacterized protein LOC134184941 n=1 Tax=Corticium candelabrum TaxID=121492 RepID=UPI002E3682E5|nr:uncharacterized protein LOC134184941 [Corticium candelabrum]
MRNRLEEMLRQAAGLLCFISLSLAVKEPCSGVDQYITTVEHVKSQLGIDFDWPFGLKSAAAYKAVVCAITLMNVDARGKDERWVKSVPYFEESDAGPTALTLHVTDLSRGSRLVDVIVDVSNQKLQILAEKRIITSEILDDTTAAKMDNGSKSIDELLSESDRAKCKRDFLDACERGTVEIDPWVRRVLDYQRRLALDRPLNFIQFLGSHNSFNNHADGYGNGDFLLNRILEELSSGDWQFVWAQQWFTMTDQMNMGVRHLMLDPIYYLGEMKLCHDGLSIPIVDKIIHFLDEILNTTIQFNSRDLGCLPHDRTFKSGLAEICDWLQQKGNENEFVMVYINDEGYVADWNHTDIIWDAVATTCPHILFTPTDKDKLFPNSWPSPRQLITRGKRLMLTGTPTVSNSNVFRQPMIPPWDKNTLKYFTPFPKCGNFKPDQWYLVGGESQVVGPIYNGPAEEGIMTRENLPFVLQCGVSCAEMDLVSPELISSAMWSFNVAPPNNSCVAISDSHFGQWVGLLCNASHNYACVNHTNSMDWVISEGKSVFGEGKKVCNAEGRVFSGPVDGHENAIIYNLMQAKELTQPVWINTPPLYINQTSGM